MLTGSIPPEIGNIPSLTSLYALCYRSIIRILLSASLTIDSLLIHHHRTLSNNLLSGTIPPELFNSTLLNMLALDNNELEGTIPPQLANTYPTLLFLYVRILPRYCVIFVSAPNSNDMSLLVVPYSNVSQNQLNGSIPGALGAMTSLITLYVTRSVDDELSHATASFGGRSFEHP